MVVKFRCKKVEYILHTTEHTTYILVPIAPVVVRIWRVYNLVVQVHAHCITGGKALLSGALSRRHTMGTIFVAEEFNITIPRIICIHIDR